MNAVIYCRVSTDRQMTEGHGIESQEKRCRDWCDKNSHTIEKIFRDEGISGSIGDRPAVKEMLEYLAAHPHTIVVIDDIKRLARDVKVYLLLKESIQALNCTIHYLNHNFEDSPEGHFIQTILAGAAQLERQQNARQTKQKMKVRLEMGYWVFNPPVGYKFEKVNGVRQLVPTESAKHIKEAFEGYNNGTIPNKLALFEFLKEKGVKVSRSQTHLLLENVKYAGYLEYDPWGVKRTKAVHEPIISLEVFEKVQQKLNDKSKPISRTKLASLFPLRGKVACSECEKNLTSYITKNRYGKEFYYYTCKTKDCRFKDRTILKEKLENEFQKLLESVKPTEATIKIVTETFTELWREYTSNYKKTFQALKRELTLIEEEQKQVADKFTKTNSEILVKALENKIEVLEKQRLQVQYKLATHEDRPTDFRTPLNAVVEAIKKAHEMWANGDFETKKIIQDFVFDGVLVYNLNLGFRTPNFSLLYQAFQGVAGSKNTNGSPNKTQFELLINNIFDIAARLSTIAKPAMH